MRQFRATAFDWTDGVTGALGLRRISTLPSPAAFAAFTAHPPPRGLPDSLPGPVKTPAWSPAFESVHQWVTTPWCGLSRCSAGYLFGLVYGCASAEEGIQTTQEWCWRFNSACWQTLLQEVSEM